MTPVPRPRRILPTPEVVYPGGSRTPVDRPRHRGRAHVLAFVRSLGRGSSEVVVKARAQDGTAVSGTHSKRRKRAGRKAATLARRRNRT